MKFILGTNAPITVTNDDGEPLYAFTGDVQEVSTGFRGDDHYLRIAGNFYIAVAGGEKLHVSEVTILLTEGEG